MFKNLLQDIVRKRNKKGSVSIDQHPWRHPYLIADNIRAFRSYSESIWKIALNYHRKQEKSLKIAFSVNMAQNMYKWAKLTQKHGAEVVLFPLPMDHSALNQPQWEEYDGEYSNIMDGKGFLKENSGINLEVSCQYVLMEGSQLCSSFIEFQNGNRDALLKLMSESNGIRHEVLMSYQGFYPYYRWAYALSKFDVIYTTSVPFAAYASGRPYCVLAVGGDLQQDCGMANDFGKAMVLSFNAARFLTVSNPHVLGHCRRLGLTNGLYLPYPMDDAIYCPGNGFAKDEWIGKYGPGVFILTTARLDAGVKGFGKELIEALIEVAIDRPEVRFIFLGWGNDLAGFEKKVSACGVWKQFIILKPVGKKRLIDYYRSCDIVLDQMVYGYYGATALEAASVGKPVIMNLRMNHYCPLYEGDIMPVFNAANPEEVKQHLYHLISDEKLRLEKGRAMREWLVRNHGEEKTVPLLLALLRLAADRVEIPKDLTNPLLIPETKEEIEYHKSCLRVG